MTSTEMTIEQQCNAAMSRCGFRNAQRREWLIWAAKNQKCPRCEEPPGKPCLHLGELKFKAREFVKVNALPHTERIDWEKLMAGLKQRGYVR